MSLEAEIGIDFARLGPLTFTLTETGGTAPPGSVTLSSGRCFLRSSVPSVLDPVTGDSVSIGYTTSLLLLLKAACDAIGDATYTWSFDTATQRVSVSATGGGVTAFAISAPNALAQVLLGWDGVTNSGALSYELDLAPYRWISCEEGGLSEYPLDREYDRLVGEDFIAHSGDVFPTAEERVPTVFDALIPLEPQALVWTQFAAALVPYTWQRAFVDLRGGELLCLYLNDGVSIDKRYLMRLRQEGVAFRPELRARNWWAVADIPIKAWLLGRV